MNVRASLLFCVGALLAAPAATAAADYVVIVNPKSAVEKLTRDEVINIFMGRNRKLPSGLNALPVDLAVPMLAKDQFYASLVGKSAQEVNSYWARLMFTGQASPPRQAESEEEVLEIVASLRGGIGYIDRKKLNKQVKVVFEFVPL